MITTPFNPPKELYKTVTIEAITNVSTAVKPRRTLPILMAAKHTEAIIMILKKTPKYKALNPRKKAAPFPL